MTAFSQVDVFSTEPFGGNPVAVVHDAEGLSGEQMQAFAAWTNLSETTFLLPPTLPGADYRVRIFTPSVELPFAGHPTLGTCHAWLAAGGVPTDPDEIVQECAAGRIPIHRIDGRLAFAAPPLIRSGPVDEATVGEVARQLRLERDAIVDAQWADNGPGWVAVLLESAEAVLELAPAAVELDIGVAGPHPAGSEVAWEVRAFFPVGSTWVEDPVTGSLNASLAGWLRDTGRTALPYVAAQGTAMGRAGRIHLSDDADGRIWIGGATVTRVVGEVDVRG